MNRLQQLALLSGLGVVMILVYARAFRPRGVSAQAPQPAAIEQPSAATETASEEALTPATPDQLAQRAAQRERAQRLAWDRDPFTFAPTAAGLGGLALSGILWDAQQPMAIINGELRRVGDALDGYRITAITQDRVSLTDGTQSYTLSIAP